MTIILLYIDIHIPVYFFIIPRSSQIQAITLKYLNDEITFSNNEMNILFKKNTGANYNTFIELLNKSFFSI